MAERLKKSLLYTFGVGDLFFGLMVYMELFYFTAFLTDYAQFSLETVGIILGITGVADIVCALWAGVILQRTTLRFGGKYRSWLLVGPPIIVPLFVLQFTRIGIDSLAAGIIIVGFLASHLLWNVVFAATGSLVGTLSKRPDEMTILSSSRAQAAAAAGFIFSYTGLGIIKFFGARTNDLLGFPITVAVFGILMILGYWYLYMITAVKVSAGEEAVKVSREETKQSIREIVVLVFRNPPLLLLIVAETFRNAGAFLISSFAFYYFGYVLNNPDFLTTFILATSVAGLLGTFIAAWLGVKIGKRNLYWLSLLLSALCLIAASFFGKTAWGFTIGFCFAGVIGILAGAMCTALFADTTTYGEWKTGKNIQAFAMALMTMTVKLGLLLRSGIMTVGLMVIGFKAKTVPAQGVIDGIRSIMYYAPAALSLLAAAVLYFGYKIDDKHILKMQDEIAARSHF